MTDITWNQAFFLAGLGIGLCVLCWIYGYVEGREDERARAEGGVRPQSPYKPR